MSVSESSGKGKGFIALNPKDRSLENSPNCLLLPSPFSDDMTMGVWIHDFVRRSEWELDVILGASLIDMYGKCGRIEEGLAVFNTMKEKNTFTRNALINRLALAKYGKETIRWFERMEREGIRIDEVSLVAVLSACSHTGLVDIGWQIFRSLSDGKYGFFPGVKHYTCMIDLLARSGCLEDALKCLREMPFEPTITIWGSLLGGAKSHGKNNLSWSQLRSNYWFGGTQTSNTKNRL